MAPSDQLPGSRLDFSVASMRMISAAILALLLAPAAALAQRLPAGVVPLHYDLTITPDLAAAKFTGQVTIRVRLEKPAKAVVLNAAEVTFRDVRIVAGGRSQAATASLDAKLEQATFTVPEPLPAGEAEIAIAYDGILNSDLRGLYLSEANSRRYAVTQLEPTDARRMFPSFDEPALKATFALTAIVDEKDHAISNGTIIADTPGPGPGKHTLKFDTTPKMSTYLVALVVGDFECIGGDADGIPVRICATPDKKALTGFALESATQILAYFNRYYSIRYPFKKLDVVAVPDFAAGAMENTAAIFYREAFLLADERASVSTRRDIAQVLAHEIAHQWFGNLVTMQWWDDIWLNEGFANWMMTKPVKTWRPDWQVQLEEIEANHATMAIDALRSTRSVRTRASTPAQISELFDAIAYGKGAAVLRMIEGWLGEEDFRKGVNAYIEKFQYGNARAEDFWGTLTEVARKPVDRVMAAFVDQPGLPLVSMRIQCGAASGRGSGTGRVDIRVSAERYLASGSSPASSKQRWPIPVCVRLPGASAQCELLEPPRQTIRSAEGTSCPAWIVGNAGGRGYYRTALAPAIVRALAADVSKLEPEERMVVLSDELALVRTGRHDAGTLLDLASGFGAERSAYVMRTLTSALRAVDREFAGAASRPVYRRWVRTLLAPALERAGIRAKPADTDEDRAFRATVIAALGGTARDPAMIENARALVLEELDKRGSIDATLLEVLVNVAPLGGDSSLYERYLARSRSATDPGERYRYLYGLASFAEPTLVRRTMDLTLSGEVRSQDVKLVLAQLLGNRDTQRVAWELVRERWAEVQKKTGEFVGNTVIVGALSSFCDAGSAASIRKFFAAHPVPDAARTLQQTLERITSCAARAQAQQPHLAAWLRAH
jgi:aminopeptidase N